VIEGDFLLCKPEETGLAWQRYKRYLTRREALGKIRIKRRSHFWLVCELIKDGILPFRPKPVDPADLLERYPRFELKDHQKEAWAYFKCFGNIGVYRPPGVGKMFFAIYVMTQIKGKKLVVVLTVTLVKARAHQLLATMKGAKATPLKMRKSVVFRRCENLAVIIADLFPNGTISRPDLEYLIFRHIGKDK
jgi:hypothetical protein